MKNSDMMVLVAAGALLLTVPGLAGYLRQPTDPRSPDAQNKRWTAPPTTPISAIVYPNISGAFVSIPAETLIRDAQPIPPTDKIFPTKPGTYSVDRGTYIEYYQVI